MRPLRPVLEGLGLSQKAASEAFGVRPDTVASWSSGRNPAPPGVLAEMHALAARQQAAADAILASYAEGAEAAGGAPGEVRLAPAHPQWPDAQWGAVLRRVWERLPPGTRLVMAEGPEVAAARRAREWTGG